MERFELTALDKELLREAIIASDRLYIQDVQEVASAIRTVDGSMFTAIHFETKGGYANVCGEVAAIACMVAGGHRDLDTIVAVWHSPQGQHCILPPCGRCRDMIREFNPEAWVILSADTNHWAVEAIERPCKVRASDLLPLPWK